MRPLLLMTGVALAGAGLLGAASPAAARQDTAGDLTCDEGRPEGWEVIPGVNTDAGDTLICNYRVTRDLNGQTFVSGVAITIEYFCTAQEGHDAFDGKTGKRDTETERSTTKVVTEEGPQAANPDNPQPLPIDSMFFPDLSFGLQEKAWEALNSQVIATLYVLTNERGVAGESQRFGVTAIEPFARTLADKNSPSSADCSIPPVGNGGGAGGGRPPTVAIMLGLGGAVVIGTWVWRRRPPGSAGTPVDSRPFPEAPPVCHGAAEALHLAEERLELLRDAHRDVSETLDSPRKIHTVNMAKARVVIGWEIISTISGPAFDLALALRLASGRPGGTGDRRDGHVETAELDQPPTPRIAGEHQSGAGGGPQPGPGPRRAGRPDDRSVRGESRCGGRGGGCHAQDLRATVDQPHQPTSAGDQGPR